MNKPPYRIPLMEEINKLPPRGGKVVSTFSGCGGSCLGYKMAGFKVVWANEFMPAAQETYRANFPTTNLDPRDIKLVTAKQILLATRLQVGELDIFDGSPPCQGFSMANQHRMKGKAKKYANGIEQKNEEMFYEYIRLLDGLQPKVFIAENVKGMVIGEAKAMLGSFQDDMFDAQEETILRSLMACGYRVQWQVLNSKNYGVPQSRQRIIFVGVRRDLNIEPVFPKPLSYLYTVRDAVPWIASVYFSKDIIKDANKNPSNTIISSSSIKCRTPNMQGEGWVEAECWMDKYAIGTEWDKLSIGEQSEKYFSLIKTNPDKPSPTICSSSGNFISAAAPMHPYEKRKWSIAELKRICGFPDDFILTGKYGEQWERLGNSVTPPLMKHIALNIRRQIFDKL